MSSLLPVAISLLFIAAFLRVGFVFHALYIVFGIYLLMAAWSARSGPSLRIRRVLESRAMPGDDLPVRLEIVNSSYWPIPWVRVFDRLPIELSSPPFHAEIVSLLPRQTLSLHYQLRCRRRGYHSLGPLRTTSGDVFGLRTVEREFTEPDYLTVYPQVLSLGELGLPSRSPFGHLKTNQILYEDPARVAGVREYQTGDSLRSINWRVTASSGRLQVRKLEPAMTLQTVLLLNLSLADYEPTNADRGAELGIVVAASLANRLIQLRQEVGLLTNGIDPRSGPDRSSLEPTGLSVGKGRAQLIAVLETLGRIQTVPTSPFTALLRDSTPRLPWGATLVVITSRETSDLWETLIILKREGFEVSIVFCDYGSPHVYDVVHARAIGLGFDCHRVWKETDLETWR